MANPTNKYVTPIGIQQPSASDLTDGTTGTGAVVQAISPALTGSPLAPTQTPLDNSTKIATTAYVNAAVTAGAAPTTPKYLLGAQAAASLPNSVALPDLYAGLDPMPASPSAYDDEFEGSSLGVAWTLYNSTNLTTTVARSRVAMSVVTQGGFQLRGFFETCPAATFEFTAKVSWNFMCPASVFCHSGLALRESSTDKLTVIGIGTTSSGSIEGATWSSATSGPSATTYAPVGIDGSMYVRVLDDATNIIMSASPDGVIWQVIKTVAVATAFTTAPNQVGFVLNDASNDGNTRYHSMDWIRRTV